MKILIGRTNNMTLVFNMQFVVSTRNLLSSIFICDVNIAVIDIPHFFAPYAAILIDEMKARRRWNNFAQFIFNIVRLDIELQSENRNKFEKTILSEFTS